jgi:serine protease Do
VDVRIWRDGKVRNLRVELNAASQNVAAHKNGAESSPGAQGRLGLAVRPLTPEKRERAGVSRGLVVQSVSDRAAEAGIRPGDIVLAVDGTPVDSGEALRSELSRHQKSMARLIQRGNERIFIPVQLG